MLCASSNRAFNSTTAVTSFRGAAVDQRRHDQRVLVGAVKRLLDREHVLIFRRRFNKRKPPRHKSRRDGATEYRDAADPRTNSEISPVSRSSRGAKDEYFKSRPRRLLVYIKQPRTNSPDHSPEIPATNQAQKRFAGARSFPDRIGFDSMRTASPLRRLCSSVRTDSQQIPAPLLPADNQIAVSRHTEGAAATMSYP